MRAARELLVRLWSHLRPRRADSEINEEMQYHLDRQVERHVAAGMSLAAARDAARREFGNVGGTADAMREAARWQWLDRVERDVRYAFRSLRRAPVFAVGVILTVALALGLNTTVFTFVNAYVFRPLAVRDPAALYDIRVSGKTPEGEWNDSWMEWDQYLSVAGLGGPVAEALARRHTYLRVNGRPAIVELVSGNYFAVLGVTPARGRPIDPASMGGPEAGAVVVLSDAMWRSDFGADPDVVGRRMPIRGVQFTIIGVAPASFTGLREVVVDFWAPIEMTDVVEGMALPGARPSEPRSAVLFRLASGHSIDVANERLANRLAAVSASRPAAEQITGVRLENRLTTIPLDLDTRITLIPLAIAFGLILLIACANVANMMLARGLARRRELGIRIAIGAGRRQLVAQLLTEAALLALPSAAVGYAISRVAIDVGMGVMLSTFPPAFAPYIRPIDLAPDLRVFAFMTLGAILAAAMFGLIPALQVTRGNIVDAVRGDGAAGPRPGRVRDALVVTQMSACLLLLVVAGVFLRTSTRARSLDTGFRTSGVIELNVNELVRERAIAALAAMPEVRAVNATQRNFLQGIYNGISVSRGDGTEALRARYNAVSPGAFEAVGMRIEEGRTFTDAEAVAGAPVVVLSRTAASRIFPGRSALGEEVRLENSAEALASMGLTTFRVVRVIGVVSDVIGGIIFTGRATNILWLPASPAHKNATLVLSVGGSAALALRAIEPRLDNLIPGAVNDVHTLDEALAGQIYPLQAASWISGLLGVIALALTISGIYGVLAYVVQQRTREIGIRLALGALPKNAAYTVVRQSLKLASIGAAIGIGLALAVSRIFSMQVELVSTFDAVAYFGSLGVALGASLAAAWIPSRRASAVNPLEAIRAD